MMDEDIIRIGNTETSTNHTPTPNTTPVIKGMSGLDNNLPSPMTLPKSSLDKSSSLRFNDNDKVLDMGTNKESIVSAPKTLKDWKKLAK